MLMICLLESLTILESARTLIKPKP
uniref:Uncharacterized protein n=1 Tax=Rhizophora mucronata TaxID=61149 RepID=A0A2P2NKN6_RHIMU